jgi:hypothetical protein
VYCSDWPFLFVYQFPSFETSEPTETTLCYIPEYLNFHQHRRINLQSRNSDSALQSTCYVSNSDTKPLILCRGTRAVYCKNSTENIQFVAKFWVSNRLYVGTRLGFTALRMHTVQFCSLDVPVGTYMNVNS